MFEVKKYNVIIVFNTDKDKILMCKRKKDPYKGLFNLVGGKVEQGETSIESAYRELYEETGIDSSVISLTHLMDFTYHIDKQEIQVFVGRVSKDVSLIEEVNELFWFDRNEDFFNMEKFAGEGNIGHMMEHVSFHEDKILGVIK